MSLKDYDIPIDVIQYVILRFVSYFDLDGILPCFKLTPCEQALIKYKIYKKRLTIVQYSAGVSYSVENKLHREDGPALECTDGYKEWYINGKLHRLNGPAVIYPSGTLAWYINGLRHRDDNRPAVTRKNGHQAWYKHGRLHRTDGPARIRSDGTKEYWINGEYKPKTVLDHVRHWCCL